MWHAEEAGGQEHRCLAADVALTRSTPEPAQTSPRTSTTPPHPPPINPAHCPPRHHSRSRKNLNTFDAITDLIAE